MAYLLPHLKSGWEVDQAIVTAEDRVVVIRFGHDQDQTCMVQDEILMSIADKVSNGLLLLTTTIAAASIGFVSMLILFLFITFIVVVVIIRLKTLL